MSAALAARTMRRASVVAAMRSTIVRLCDDSGTVTRTIPARGPMSVSRAAGSVASPTTTSNPCARAHSATSRSRSMRRDRHAGVAQNPGNGLTDAPEADDRNGRRGVAPALDRDRVGRAGCREAGEPGSDHDACEDRHERDAEQELALLAGDSVGGLSRVREDDVEFTQRRHRGAGEDGAAGRDSGETREGAPCDKTNGGENGAEAGDRRPVHREDARVEQRSDRDEEERHEQRAQRRDDGRDHDAPGGLADDRAGDERAELETQTRQVPEPGGDQRQRGEHSEERFARCARQRPPDDTVQDGRAEDQRDDHKADRLRDRDGYRRDPESIGGNGRHDEQRDRDEVLHDELRDGEPPGERGVDVPSAQQRRPDGGTRHGRDQADRQRVREPEQGCSAGRDAGDRRHDEQVSGERERSSLRDIAEREAQPDAEEQKDEAERRERLERIETGDVAGCRGTDRHTGSEIAEDRVEAQPARERAQQHRQRKGNREIRQEQHARAHVQPLYSSQRTRPFSSVFDDQDFDLTARTASRQARALEATHANLSSTFSGVRSRGRRLRVRRHSTVARRGGRVLAQAGERSNADAPDERRDHRRDQAHPRRVRRPARDQAVSEQRPRRRSADARPIAVRRGRAAADRQQHPGLGHPIGRAAERTVRIQESAAVPGGRERPARRLYRRRRQRDRCAQVRDRLLRRLLRDAEPRSSDQRAGGSQGAQGARSARTDRRRNL